jgi:hypothetical protein
MMLPTMTPYPKKDGRPEAAFFSSVADGEWG